MARFLVRMNASSRLALAAAEGQAVAPGFSLSPLMPNSHAVGKPFGLAGDEDWFLATTDGEATAGDAWDECHARTNALGAAAGVVSYAEPDIIQPFVVEEDRTRSQVLGFDGLLTSPPEEYWMPDVGIPHGTRFDWHLDDKYSGLRNARNLIESDFNIAPDAWRVRIGHLDTGYTDSHLLLPRKLERTLQRSFVAGDNTQSAVDPFKTGFMKNPGHGTGTLCLLAGNKLSDMGFADENTDDYLGGAPHATVIPVRIAESVVLMRTSTFVQGLDYLLAPNGDPDKRVDVVSMSMGGVCSAAWTDIVNRAYDAGVVLCAAAGNHFGDLPPTSIVYPARYRRVIAVCGVMQDGRPYADLPTKTMCGCYGPESKMSTAIAAYSPNLPWALYNNTRAFRWDGQGTSAATPQVAAAAALYIEAHYDNLKNLPGWKKVEAVRNALFTAAQHKQGTEGSRIGTGALDAVGTLLIPVSASFRSQERPDEASFPFLRVLTGFGIDGQPGTPAMLNVEILQITQKFPNLQKILPDPDFDGSHPQKDVDAFLSAITTIPEASKHLKAALSNRLKTRSVAVPQLPSSPGDTLPKAASPASKAPKPPCRKLRGYVFDPSMSTELQYVNLSETTYRVRWEHDLKPGPTGEYLEVVDDSAPLDLNDPHLLAQDGLEPTECNAQFRRQMLYAVGMQTIDLFESALGRLVNWAQDDRERDGPIPPFRQHLQLYPHGIQAPNAFYSPTDRAIYFGRFKATEETGTVYPGMVYAALSHDIIAHEMTHALLDGIHKSFREPSNPDVLAFHEAFADIVALLQQFSNIDIVKSQSAAVRGNLSMESLLGNLARQFGQATKGRSALRSAYLQFDDQGHAKAIEPNPNQLTSATESHDRGALLVAAVYGALLAIYHNRTVDLYRIASDGKSDTALNLIAPDLVNRLALEASRAARHVLKMCIRAIDYCPPVDITFGEFLRAIVTADIDVVPDDPLHYRVAFIESFRRWRLYPEGLEALSSEALVYPSVDLCAAVPAEPSSAAVSDDQGPLEGKVGTDSTSISPAAAVPSESHGASVASVSQPAPEINAKPMHEKLKPVFDRLREFAGQQSVTSQRKALFEQNQRDSKALTEILRTIVRDGDAIGVIDALGLDADTSFQITRLRFSHKTSPAGSPRPRVLVSISQPDEPDVEVDMAGVPLRWGVTLIIDLPTDQVLYRISKRREEVDRMSRSVLKINGTSFSRLGLDEPFMLLHQS